jgi:hypothetical protein
MHHHQHHDVGLALIHNPLVHSADVIFVHGLRGHRSHTWETKSGQFWLEWLGGLLPGIRVWSYGYNANTVSGSQDVFYLYATQFLSEMSSRLPVHTFFFYCSLCTYTGIKLNL